MPRISHPSCTLALYPQLQAGSSYYSAPHGCRQTPSSLSKLACSFVNCSSPSHRHTRDYIASDSSCLLLLFRTKHSAAPNIYFAVQRGGYRNKTEQENVTYTLSVQQNKTKKRKPSVATGRWWSSNIMPDITRHLPARRLRWGPGNGNFDPLRFMLLAWDRP